MERLVIAALLAIVAGAPVAAQDPRDIIRRAFAQDENIFNSLRDYTYVERQVTRNLDKKGRVSSTEDETHEVLFLYGAQYEKLIGKNGKPLPAAEARKQDEKMDREAAKRKRDSERGRNPEDKERAERRRAAREIPDAFDFRLVGTEVIGGQSAWIIDATPKPGYKAKSRQSRMLAKVSGRMWIEQTENSLAKADIRVDETISFGLILFRLKPGARIEFERTRLGANTWLPKHSLVKGEAKLGLLKTFRIEVESDYSDYKRFQTESTITVAGAE